MIKNKSIINKTKTMKKIYICGKISGMAWGAARAKFEETEKMLVARGYEVVNPIKLCSPETDWKKCMRKDIGELVKCDGIYIMNNWKKSNGARIEISVAIAIMDENNIWWEDD